mmetsp:Transcript_37953/g.81577  ORF Transcript_37953/g.81577 Transcript_37953/m.81577 type:complete len:376 (+) Transcript_37953:113-1240(+)
MTFFVFLSTAARAWIVGPHLLLGTAGTLASFPWNTCRHGGRLGGGFFSVAIGGGSGAIRRACALCGGVRCGRRPAMLFLITTSAQSIVAGEEAANGSPKSLTPTGQRSFFRSFRATFLFRTRGFTATTDADVEQEIGLLSKHKLFLDFLNDAIVDQEPSENAFSMRGALHKGDVVPKVGIARLVHVHDDRAQIVVHRSTFTLCTFAQVGSQVQDRWEGHNLHDLAAFHEAESLQMQHQKVGRLVDHHLLASSHHFGARLTLPGVLLIQTFGRREELQHVIQGLGGLRDLQRQVPEGLEGKAAGGAFPASAGALRHQQSTKNPTGQRCEIRIRLQSLGGVLQPPGVLFQLFVLEQSKQAIEELVRVLLSTEGKLFA